MLKVGFVGWRGMVGSVLMQRMIEEGDFADIEPQFFTTSQVGLSAPAVGKDSPALKDAKDIAALKVMDVIVTCQGGSYTNEIFPKLRADGWQDWATSMTYQAASGAGAQNMRELIHQMGDIHQSAKALLDDPASAILEIDKTVADTMRADGFPTDQFGVPLAGSLIPWIDADLGNGQSKEEWKGGVETNKILGRQDNPIVIDGLCVRVGAMRCHSQALTIKLKQDIPLDEINGMLNEANEWASVIPDTRDASIPQLSPTAITGSLNTPVGRVRKMAMGGDYISAFTVGDQLLWGAAEPLRRMLRILVQQ